jgi:5-methylcytosine-specific restriction endonuclease McrA
MERLKLKKLLDSGKSTREIAELIGRGQTTVRYWIKKHGLRCKYHEINRQQRISDICEAVAKSTSYSEVCRKLKIPRSGNSYQNMRSVIERLSLDVSHFTGQRKYLESIKLTPYDVLIYDRLDGRRERTIVLRNALTELGVDVCRCSLCGLDSWLGKPLGMHIDHIDGDRLNNIRDNLRILCPNCHNQITYNK